MKLRHACDLTLAKKYAGTEIYKHAKAYYDELCARHPGSDLFDLTSEALEEWVEDLQHLEATTINKRLSVVSKMVQHHLKPNMQPVIPWQRIARKLKWWPTPDIQVHIVTWCRRNNEPDFADYLTWSVETGLRVMETLRCERRHFIGLDTGKPALTVPGTKTQGSQITLPISRKAAALCGRRLKRSVRLFPWSYNEVGRIWDRCREDIGLANVNGATLKAFRRAYARTATVAGMPAPILQGMLRHRTFKTTEGYLELVGGYTMEERGKYVW
jgi:integrase